MKALKSQADALDKEYKILDAGLRDKREVLNNNLPVMTQLIFENMFAQIRQQQDFIEKVIRALNS